MYTCGIGIVPPTFVEINTILWIFGQRYVYSKIHLSSLTIGLYFIHIYLLAPNTHMYPSTKQSCFLYPIFLTLMTLVNKKWVASYLQEMPILLSQSIMFCIHRVLIRTWNSHMTPLSNSKKCAPSLALVLKLHMKKIWTHIKVCFEGVSLSSLPTPSLLSWS